MARKSVSSRERFFPWSRHCIPCELAPTFKDYYRLLSAASVLRLTWHVGIHLGPILERDGHPNSCQRGTQHGSSPDAADAAAADAGEKVHIEGSGGSLAADWLPRMRAATRRPE